MDVPFVIRQRLEKLGLEQRDLARAAGVTESYISQLLRRKKAPPAPDRTDIYDAMDRFLRLPRGKLAKVAELHRNEELKRRLGDTPQPLFPELRDVLLRTCRSGQAKQVRATFEQQPFGEVERLVSQKLLEVARRASSEAFGGTDLFHLSRRHLARLDALIESWDLNLATFDLTIALRPRAAAQPATRFTYVETPADPRDGVEPGLEEFLRDPALSATVTPEELAFLRGLRFAGVRPTALYYYRELQNLRDPLHFKAAGRR